MPHVLLVDYLKSSLVMTSEVFKDKIVGCTIDIVKSGNECVEYLKNKTPDMIVCDFDLPDTDGVMLSKTLRKIFKGPVVITAYPDDIVAHAIKKELFVYNDSCAWVKKPVRFDELSEKIDQFLLGNRRLVKRFTADFETLLIGKGEGRGKRAPKVCGTVLDMGVGGFMIESVDSIKMKKGDEVTVTLNLPRALLNDAEIKPAPLKLKASIAWIAKGRTKAGVEFRKLSETQRKIMEGFVSTMPEVTEDLRKVAA